ncbi:MAG TPA: cation:proton antiporter [Candidatus Limiplasma sp.]|nr:cation:proton antiporter [Candidatus Limiplasma sp.]HPR77485.1 cation:proton antiporter [Candidatus Limiplasma sp.]
MLSYNYLLDIALILLCTKLLGLFTRKMHMPQVVGALLAGIVLGPAALNILHETNFIKQVAELGVIILMFNAGLETNITELRKAGKASFVIALIGVLVPLVGGFIIAFFFNRGDLVQGNTSVFLQNMFIGVILTATSVSITVETLKELGKLDTRAGSAILGAALIDDVMGIIALTIITSFADPTVNLWTVLLKIALFFVFVAVAGYIFYKLFTLAINRNSNDLRRYVIVSFVFCLLMSFCAEYFFDVADITGAYFAGLIICNTKKSKYIASRFETLSYILLSPIFFASIGLSVTLPSMSANIIWFSVLLLLIAIISKIIGCGFGARICRYSKEESLQIGVGMISRGEVALIVANKGMALGLMSSVFFGPVIIVVIATTIITPILLKIVFNREKQIAEPMIESPLVAEFNEAEKLEMMEQKISEAADGIVCTPSQEKKKI